MHQPSKFWDKIAERYAKEPVADEAAYQKKLQVTRQYLRPDMEVMARKTLSKMVPPTAGSPRHRKFQCGRRPVRQVLPLDP